MHIIELHTFKRLVESRSRYKEKVEYINKTEYEHGNCSVPIINRATRLKTYDEAKDFANNFRLVDRNPYYTRGGYRVIGNMKTRVEKYSDGSGDTYAFVPMEELTEFDDNRWKRLSVVYNLVIKKI